MEPSANNVLFYITLYYFITGTNEMRKKTTVLMQSSANNVLFYITLYYFITRTFFSCLSLAAEKTIKSVILKRRSVGQISILTPYYVVVGRSVWSD